MNSGNSTVLIADDDADDRLMTQDAFRDCNLENPLHFVGDGEELLDYLHRRGPFADERRYPTPSLILLDLNMPRMDGREALREIKSSPYLRHIPVVILTTSRAEFDIRRSYEEGVNSFITKPASFVGLVEVIGLLNRYWLQTVALPAAYH